MIFELVLDFSEALAAMPREHLKRRNLALLAEAIRRDIHFSARHPTTLFQCLWNSCWWQDSPEAASHYVLPEGGWKETPCGEDSDPSLKLCAFLERWRAERAAKHSGLPWVRALRPPFMRLGGGQYSVLHGHEDRVFCVAYSPDGRRVLSGSVDKTVRLWDAETGRALAVLRGHQGVVNSVGFSPNGFRLLSGSSDNTIRLWEAESGRELAILRGHESAVNSVAFSPDGLRLLSGSDDNTIRLWDTESGRELAILRGHDSAVNSVAFSPDGRRMLSGSGDKTVRLWDGQSGGELAVMSRHEHTVTCVAFSPDGERILSASCGKVRLWDALSGRELADMPNHRGDVVIHAAFSPDGRRLVGGGMDDRVHLWDAETGRPLNHLLGHERGVWSVAFSPDGRRVVSGSWDHTVRLWHAQSGQDLPVLCWQGAGDVEFSPDGSHVLDRSDTGWGGRLWDTESGQVLFPLGPGAKLTDVAFSPDGNRVLSAFGRKVVVWHAESRQKLAVLHGHEGRVNSLAFSPDSRQMLSGSSDKTVRLWDTEGGCDGKKAPPRDLEGGSDSGILNTIRHLVQSFKETTVPVVKARPLPERHSLLATEVTELVRPVKTTIPVPAIPVAEVTSPIIPTIGPLDIMLRNLERELCDGVPSGRELAVLRGHEGSVTCVVFSPDGCRVLSGSYDKTVRLWDARSGRELSVLCGHESKVISVAFSPSGRYALSVSDDETTRRWDVQTGECLEILQGRGDIAVGADVFPWLMSTREGETVIEPVKGGPPAAWFPHVVVTVATHPGGRTWAGHVSNQLVLLRLEGG